MEVYQIVFLLVGGGIGFGVGYWVSKLMVEKNSIVHQQAFNELKFKLKARQEEVQRQLTDLQAKNQEIQKERQLVSNLNIDKSRLQADYHNLQKRLVEQKKELENIREKFTHEFKNLANDIFEEKSKRFTDQNKSQIHDLLKPLGEKIISFEKRVEETNKESIARNSALKEQISGFKELNERVTKEAENLVKALKGDTKAQGNWGEIILESILEKSGLEKDREYFIQESLVNEDGKRYQPDVVVKLPDSKNIVVDSKVSLVAYERYVNTEDEKERASELKTHLLSLRSHIKGLSEKNYQNLYGVEGLDFVLMFVPIEPAFSLAVQQDPELFNDAYAKNIVIVSPATLIATLRTIASIWKQEYQNRYAIEIASEGGKMYDKLVAFVEDIKKVGVQLNTTQKTYHEATKKLYDGTGNLVTRAEKMRKLGAKATKNMDQNFIDKSEQPSFED